MGLLIILAVVPSLQIARLGVDEDIANVLAGFRIVLSPDKHEVVRLVVYYMWCVEGESNQEAEYIHIFIVAVPLPQATVRACCMYISRLPNTSCSNYVFT